MSFRSPRQQARFLDRLRDRASTHHDCSSKQRYTSKRIAEGVLRVMRETRGATRTLGAYKCALCKHWHLGNASRR